VVPGPDRHRQTQGTRAAENWHYDVTENKRRQAIRLGAVPVPWHEIPQIIDARYAQGTETAG